METCPEILGYILIDRQNPETGDCYVGFPDLNEFESEHEQKIQHVNKQRLQDLKEQYGKPTKTILNSVKVAENYPRANKASPLNRFFKKLPKNEFVENLFRGKKTIITTNRRVVQDIIKFGRAEGIKELKLSAAKNQLEGANFPGNIIDSTTVTTWNENIQTADYRKYNQKHGLKFENYVTSNGGEDGESKSSSFRLYAILYLEIGSDTILLYNAETDAVMKGPRDIATAELKLSPEVKENVDIRSNLETVFHSRNPSLENIQSQMPVLQVILGRTDKLIVAYTGNGYRGTVWKGVMEYDFHQVGHNLLEEDVKALGFFVDKVLSIELMTRDTQEDKIKWNNLLIQRCPDENNVKCLREYYWGPMFENTITE